MKDKAQQIMDSLAAWRRVNQLQEMLAAHDLPATNTARSLEYLQPAFVHAHATGSPEPTSGLIEQQRWFRMLHGR